MKCKICERFFVNETTFKNLYTFPSLCDDCRRIYQPFLQFEVIPYDKGIVTYYYLFDELKLNVRQRIYLNKHWGILFDMINKLNVNKTTVIIIDQEFLNSFKEEFIYIKKFSSLFFLSLMRCNFDDLMIFF